MCKQVANRDVVNRAKLIVHLPQFGHITYRAIIQRQLAPVAQLQNGDCGHRLGDRGPVVRRFSVDRLLGIFAGLAEEPLRCRFLHVDDGDPAAHHPMLRQNCIEALGKSIPLCARRCCSDQTAREEPAREQRCAGDGRAVRHEGHDNTPGCSRWCICAPLQPKNLLLDVIAAYNACFTLSERRPLLLTIYTK